MAGDSLGSTQVIAAGAASSLAGWRLGTAVDNLSRVGFSPRGAGSPRVPADSGSAGICTVDLHRGQSAVVPALRELTLSFWRHWGQAKRIGMTKGAKG
jgi:hypothetical protein